VASIAVIVRLTPQQRPIQPKAAVVSAGPNNGSSCVNDTSGPSGASVNWLNEFYPCSGGGWAWATLNFSTATNTYYLKATGFGFSIPTGSTINGIFAEVERRRDPIDPADAQDGSVKIVKGGAVVGNEKKSSANWPTTTGIYQAYGGMTDLWGVSWTLADINSSGFGLAFAAHTGPTGANYEHVMVGHIRITVYYTPPPPPPDTTPPSAPSNLNSTGKTTTSVSLAWNASTDSGGSGLAGYRIYRNGSEVGTTSTTSYASSGLSPSTSYSYYVRAYDNAGNLSVSSGTINVTTNSTKPTVSISASPA